MKVHRTEMPLETRRTDVQNAVSANMVSGSASVQDVFGKIKTYAGAFWPG